MDARALLKVDPPMSSKFAVLGATRYGDSDIQAVEVQSVAQVWCPAWMFLPKGPYTKLVLVLEPNGRNARWREDDLYHQVARWSRRLRRARW